MVVTDRLGFRPGATVPSIGDTDSNQHRIFQIGSAPPHHYWVHRMGIRAGRDEIADVNTSIILTLSGPSSFSGPTLLGQTAAVVVTAYMGAVNEGSDYEANLQAVTRLSSTLGSYHLGATSNNGFRYGETSSTAPHSNAAAYPPAASFGYVIFPTTRGQMNIWADADRNERPNLPHDITPTAGAQLASTMPVIGASFSDPNEIAGAFGIGFADKVGSAQIEVYNASGTSRLYTSGTITPTAAEQTARRIERAVTSALLQGSYIAKIRFADLFGDWSDWASSTFAVTAIGATENVRILPAMLSSTWPIVTTNLRPTYRMKWVSSSSRATASIQVQLYSGTTVVRGPTTVTRVVGHNIETDITFTQLGWTDIPGGIYRVEARATDSAGLLTGWNGYSFRVDLPPPVPTNLFPNGITFTPLNIPRLQMTVSHPVLDAEQLEPTFEIQKPDLTWIGVAGHYYLGAGRWGVDLEGSITANFGTWKWRVKVRDPGGQESPQTPDVPIVYAPAPNVAITSPANGTTVTIANPTVTWTIDTTQSKFRIIVTPTLGGQVIYDSGLVTSATPSHVIPAGKLRNNVSYRIALEAQSATSVPAQVETLFTLTYTSPTASVVSAAPETTTYDLIGYPSFIRIGWTQTTIPVDSFEGYLVKRVEASAAADESSGGDAASRTTLAVIHARDVLTYLDTTPTSGVAYVYEVTALQRVYLDQLESVPGTSTASVSLRSTVISAVGLLNGYAAVLPTWAERSRTPQVLSRVYETWDGGAVAYASPNTGVIISGTFQIARTVGSFERTGEDLMETLEQLRSPQLVSWVDAKGATQTELVPTVVCYRDPRGRKYFGVITECPLEDARIGWGRVPLVITTVSHIEGSAMT